MLNLCFVTVLVMLLEGSLPQRLASIKARAETGDSKAQVQLGVAYAAGDGVAADDAEAAKWFRRAAEQSDAAGEYSLGEMYLTGRGVSADSAEAAKWMRRAAKTWRFARAV
jgi:TPR repeat protein